jgi:hypothetical protein
LISSHCALLNTPRDTRAADGRPTSQRTLDIFSRKYLQRLKPSQSVVSEMQGLVALVKKPP